MSHWPATKARHVLAALLKTGWHLKRQSGSHRTLSRDGWPDVTFAFHDDEEIGPKMLARIARRTPQEPMITATVQPAVHTILRRMPSVRLIRLTISRLNSIVP